VTSEAIFRNRWNLAFKTVLLFVLNPKTHFEGPRRLLFLCCSFLSVLRPCLISAARIADAGKFKIPIQTYQRFKQDCVRLYLPRDTADPASSIAQNTSPGRFLSFVPPKEWTIAIAMSAPLSLLGWAC